MKKLAKILSILMLISMLFSIMAPGVFATSGDTVVIFDNEGTDVNGTSSSGSVVISADPNAELTSNEDGSGSTESKKEETSEEKLPVNGSTYSILSTSANALEYFQSEEMLQNNPMIYYNAKYIVYIREHMDELKVSDPDVVETAYALFGEEYLDKEFGKTTTVVTKEVALKTQIEYLDKIIAALENVSEDTDSVLAVRKAASEYVEAFEGVANYDYTSEDSGFASAAEALEAAKSERANVNSSLSNLANDEGEKEEEKEENKDETTEEVVESPAPTTTPTPNDALPTESPVPTESPAPSESQDSEETTVEEVVETVTEIVKEPASLTATFKSPLQIFKSLFTNPLTSYATVNALSGKTTTVTETMTITGLANFELVICLNNAVINNGGSGYVFEINDPNTFVTFEAMTINGPAFHVTAGNVVLKYVHVNSGSGIGVLADASSYEGRIELGNCEFTATGSNPCISCNGTKAVVDINGYNKISNSSGNAVEATSGTVYIDGTDTAESIISANSASGIYVNGANVYAYGQAKISGANGVYVVNGNFTMSDSVHLEGIAKSSGSGAYGCALAVETPGHAYISGGYLTAEYGYAIYTANTPDAVRVANGEQVVITSYYDCKDQYSDGIITVNDVSYATISAANTAIADENTKGNAVTVELLGDITGVSATTLTFDGVKNATLIGNGHAISNTSGTAVTIKGNSNVNISNITLEGSIGVDVSGTSNVSLNDNTIIKATSYCIGGSATKPSITINDAVLHGEKAFYIAENTSVVVNSCKDNCKDPIGTVSSPATLMILGGYYLYKTGVETYVPSGIAYISDKTNSDGYYVVSMDSMPTVTTSSNITSGVDSNGIPYIVYDKANPKYITFTVDPKVLRIDGVPIKGGSTINIFNNTAKGGTEGDITIDIDAFQNNLAAGIYDIQFQFANGYVMTDRVHLYVLPETSKLVKSDFKTSATQYTVGSKEYIYAEVSEMPTRIGVSNDSTGSVISWFDYYDGYTEGVNQKYVIDGSSISDSEVSKKDKFILVDYAYLDQLSSGQSYIFLDYNGAIKRLDLKIVNNNVKISPTSLDFWGTDSNAVFTVTPDYKDVYIDGELVPTEFVKYDTTTHKLTISGEYLEHISSGNHLMEVETSQGWVSANVHTGVGLAADGVDYHVYGGAKALAFKASDVIDTTAGIWIGKNNPVKVDSTLIYFYNNDTKFTISPSYLNRLGLGTYYISAYVWNGEDYEYTSTTFRIVSASSAAYNPSTGDTFRPIVWIIIAALAVVIALVFLVPALKKNGGLLNKPEDSKGEKVEEKKAEQEKSPEDKEKE